MHRVFRVFLVDDDAVVRHALGELIQCDADMEVVGEAADVNEALASIPPCRPDVVLLDDRLADGGGFDLCRNLRALMPGLHCIILTSFGSRNDIFDALRAGASGCIVRNAKGAEVVAGIKRAAAGDLLYDIGAATAYLADRARENVPDAASLTEREGELLALVREGRTDGQLASRMHIDESAFRACLWGLVSKARDN